MVRTIDRSVLGGFLRGSAAARGGGRRHDRRARHPQDRVSATERAGGGHRADQPPRPGRHTPAGACRTRPRFSSEPLPWVSRRTFRSVAAGTRSVSPTIDRKTRAPLTSRRSPMPMHWRFRLHSGPTLPEGWRSRWPSAGEPASPRRASCSERRSAASFRARSCGRGLPGSPTSSLAGAARASRCRSIPSIRGEGTISQRVVTVAGRRLRQRFNLSGSTRYGADVALEADLSGRLRAEL